VNNYESHALQEFRAAGWVDENGKFIDDMQEMMCKQVIDLLNLFATHGHSGSSAPYAINMFEKLAKFDPIAPLTGEDWEWSEVSAGVYQNKRCSHVFKQADRFDGQAYDIDAIVFWDWVTDKDTGEQYKSHYTSSDSFVPITFPYVPHREYRESVSNDSSS
jgi:hypothetical protein